MPSDGPPRERNTGYQFDLVDHDAVERDAHGLLVDHMAQLGTYDSRHDAVGMAAIVGRRFGYDYDVRAHESMWTKREEPVVCDSCGYEEWYAPLVNWTFVAGDDPDAGTYCTTECRARAEYEVSADV